MIARTLILTHVSQKKGVIVDWCGGTESFDSTLYVALPHIDDKAIREYQEFQHVLDGSQHVHQPWAKNLAKTAEFPSVGNYQKTYITPAIEYTGHNFCDVRAFCDVDSTWGLANETDTYGNAGPCTLARGDYACAVYDHLHRAWIPFTVGDHIVEGPTKEHYPIEADVMRTTYREVFELKPTSCGPLTARCSSE